MHIDAELDASGLHCPLPLLKAKKALSGLTVGQTLRIVATDPGSVRDFEAFSRQAGHMLLSSQPEAERFVFVIKKGGPK